MSKAKFNKSTKINANLLKRFSLLRLIELKKKKNLATKQKKSITNENTRE